MHLHYLRRPPSFHQTSSGNVSVLDLEPLELKKIENNYMPNLTEYVDGSRVLYCTEVRFASFLSSGLTTMAVINPPEKKLTNYTSVQ